MRFVAHIKSGDLLIARASVDDQPGEQAIDTATRGIDQMRRDMRRNNRELAEGASDKARADLVEFEMLTEAYGEMIVDALANRKGTMRTGNAQGGRVQIRSNMTTMLQEPGMTVLMEAHDDEWIACRKKFLEDMTPTAA